MITLDDILGSGAKIDLIKSLSVDYQATVIFSSKVIIPGLVIKDDQLKPWVLAIADWPEISCSLTLGVGEQKEVFVGEGFCIRNSDGEITATPQDQFEKQPNLMVELFTWGKNYGCPKVITDVLSDQSDYMEALGWEFVESKGIISRWQIPSELFPVRES